MRNDFTEQQVAIAEKQRKIFGERFKEAREAAGYTQRDITNMTGITQTVLSKVENGLANLTMDRVAILADCVGVPLTKLFSPTRTN